MCGLICDEPAVLSERRRRQVAYLGLTHTIGRLDALLTWATKERSDYTTLREHVLSAEVDHKSAARIERRILRSGLSERKNPRGLRLGRSCANARCERHAPRLDRFGPPPLEAKGGL
jgi:hypothetical protein